MGNSFLFIVLFVFINIFGYSQGCEEYRRELFGILPDNFSKKEINCKDSLGRKQGAWIHYKIKYKQGNPHLINLTDTGYYVDQYVYGFYKADLKVGKWITVEDFYEKRIDNYYYLKDTIRLESKFLFDKSVMYYTRDSSFIKSLTTVNEEIFPLCIDCNKNRIKGKECVVSYRNKTIRYFSFIDFELEFENTFSNLSWDIRQKRNIDEELK